MKLEKYLSSFIQEERAICSCKKQKEQITFTQRVKNVLDEA
jgi:hypothetical protein